MTTRLTRQVRFQARHRLWRDDWPAERNREAFGPLAESHPHDYACAVTVAGPVDPVSGMIMDLGRLDQLLKEEVQDALAGKDLNRDVDPFRSGRPIPTCEALAQHLFARLHPRLPAGVSLTSVRVAEDPTLHAECTGLA